MADMQELIARLEAAEVGSRELDALICCALHDGPDWAVEAYYPLGSHGLYSVGRGGPGLTAECYTTRLDAALALAERVMSSWRVFGVSDERDFQVNSGWAAGICELRGPGIQHARSSTPALALCIAILKAKAQGEGG